MNKLQALTALRDKVKAGDIRYHGFLDIAEPAFNRADVFSIDAWKAYNGSLDAALALHEAVLPGWWFKIVSPEPDYVQVGMKSIGVYAAASESPARAWLLAILEALITQERETTQ